MCKNKQGDLVLMNGGSWPPCEEKYHPACADGSSLTCSDGSAPQPPQLCTNEEDVPTCQDENGNESDAECRRPNQIPTDFFCGRFHPAKCPEGFQAMCSDGPAMLPKRGNGEKGKGHGKGKGKGHGKGKGEGKGHGKGKGKGKGKGDSTDLGEVNGEQFCENEEMLRNAEACQASSC